MDKKLKPLGVAQRELLAEIAARGGYWYAGCGWIYYNIGRTKQTLNTLAARGLLTITTTQHGDTYTLTEQA